MCLQVNPLAETKDGKLIAADAKLGFDDNAAFRQKELFSLRDTTQEDPRSVSAACSHIAACIPSAQTCC
jgi:succinyl-CoA synthetase beta subunit